jgi:hypothetical protein
MSKSIETRGSSEDDRNEHNRRHRARRFASIVWLAEPKPLCEASKILVHGVAIDAAPEVLAAFNPASEE